MKNYNDNQDNVENSEFWDHKYKNNETKWDIGCPTPVFKEWVETLDPKKSISPFIEDLTGISNSMVQGKPSFPDVEDDFLEFIADLPIVGHNVGFDINFIKRHSKMGLGTAYKDGFNFVLQELNSDLILEMDNLNGENIPGIIFDLVSG